MMHLQLTGHDVLNASIARVSQGMGRAIALELAHEVAKFAIVARRELALHGTTINSL